MTALLNRAQRRDAAKHMAHESTKYPAHMVLIPKSEFSAQRNGDEMNLPLDVARCIGYRGDAGWSHPVCLKYARRTAQPAADPVPWLAGVVIGNRCEFRIESKVKNETEN